VDVSIVVQPWPQSKQSAAPSLRTHQAGIF